VVEGVGAEVVDALASAYIVSDVIDVPERFAEAREGRVGAASSWTGECIGARFKPFSVIL
jgi:hypothetical protein